MTRVHVICEGQTEETFVNEVLKVPFASQGVYLAPSLIGKPRHKGGNFKIERLLADLQPRLLGDTAAYTTTFFDFYGLPENFPGKREASSKSTSRDKSACVLAALLEVLETNLGQDPIRRFIPYIQMYEFEGLLFSDPAAMASGIDQPGLAERFQEIRQDFATPEDINNSPNHAPSKRIAAIYRQYEKPIHGSLVALEAGLSAIRAECRLFDEWLCSLERL